MSLLSSSETSHSLRQEFDFFYQAFIWSDFMRVLDICVTAELETSLNNAGEN